jgi:hypothetical protein
MADERPFITLPSDQPTYEALTDLTMEQKAALPARFHTPVWSDSTPGAFICSVCWVEGETVSWPCLPALSRGWDVFDDPKRMVVPVPANDSPASRQWPAPGDRVAWTLTLGTVPAGAPGTVSAVDGRTAVVSWDQGGENRVYTRHLRALSEVPAVSGGGS